ncbi:RHS repeat domain-containing protein [Bacilliculturomica massiliensis]|uniref:RHS repeat domain-containing protein n=1 Tax=Bacilliculturomica massiliensis TaxID=1917867 RepID=UPI001030E1E6|nr:RHS repeat domain-containing protein [Bacilliculturomica massiliensis]
MKYFQSKLWTHSKFSLVNHYRNKKFASKLVKSALHRIDGLHDVDEYQITIYQHDGNGQVTKVLDAVGKETLNVYDGNGNLVQTTDVDGNMTEYSYNYLDLATNINYNDGKQANSRCNKAGGQGWKRIGHMRVRRLLRIFEENRICHLMGRRKGGKERGQRE